MHESWLPPVSPLQDHVVTSKALDPLPVLNPHFFIPRLEDKPQNPIMDTLRIMQNRLHDHPPPPTFVLPPELHALSEDTLLFAEKRRNALESLWELAAARKSGFGNQALSWDALRPSFNGEAAPSSFLSEQSTEAFASARYHLRPPLQHPDVQLVYVQVPDLFQSLLLTVCGTSSHLHIWNSSLQKFVLRNLQGRKRGEIVIVSKDEVLSASLLKRFLTIGNLMRRLEQLTDDRESHLSDRSTPIKHAFAHALSSVLGCIRQNAERIPPDLQATPNADARLMALWTKYESMENVLEALAALCGREEHIDPQDYIPIPSAPAALLSLIYRHLNDLLERSAPRVVTATIAYILTTTSNGYFQTLCTSVGYNTSNSRGQLPPHKDRQYTRRQGSGDIVGDDYDHVNERPEEEIDTDLIDFPEFIPPEIEEILSRARKSLVLLRAADPDNPLLTSILMHPDIEWLWTEEQLDNMEDGISLGQVIRPPPHLAAAHTFTPEASSSSTAEVLQAFRIFDLVPGEHNTGNVAASSGLLSGSRSASALREFLDSFPPTLPPSTPTLAHLTSRVLAPLVAHAQALSGALVARFLAPTTHLHLHTHLVLLRGHLLVTAHPFKARLQDALFSDAEDISAPVVGSRTYAAAEARENARERSRARSGQRQSRNRAASAAGASEKAKKTRRAVGLSPALTIGDKWPPLGSDLNFLLRTVIVDALEDGRTIGVEDGEVDDVAQAQRMILEEGEWRLGFAIRDMPVGTGREKWLSPLSIEALDFLYMEYNPPHPLNVLITPGVLSKYHRMFAFNLRLMRVENVVRTLFRLTRRAARPLFPTLTPAHKLLLHFRFVAHAFIMTLASYVYDIAIGSNIDTFLARLAAASPANSPPLTASTGPRPEGGAKSPGAFADVFSLAEYHSRVLDDVLSACLLRSGQKAVGDILRGCMELVLELGVLAGELHDGNLEEYEAAPALEDLWQRFKGRMITFVKVLKALVEKEADSARLVLSDIPLHMMQGPRRVSGTTANLHQLLLRLNMSDWWTRKDVPHAT